MNDNPDGHGDVKGTNRMDRPPPKLLTTGKIAAELGVPIHRVVYVLDTRPWIRPTAIAGNLRLYTRDEGLPQIRHELNAIDAKRTRRSAILDRCPSPPLPAAKPL